MVEESEALKAAIALYPTRWRAPPSMHPRIPQDGMTTIC